MARDRDPYKPDVIIRNGKPSAVVLKIEDYEAMLEQLEQIDDLKAIRSLKKRDWQTVSFDEYLRGNRQACIGLKSPVPPVVNWIAAP